MNLTLCKRNRTPEQTLFDAFAMLDIESHKKTVLQDRYLKVLENFHSRARSLSYYYYITRVIVTVGSILVPAFLSIQSTSVYIYWNTWIISIAVTICNGFMTLFKLDKKYYFINTTLELLHSEGWQYVGLSGRYATKEGQMTTTHENQFIIFFKMAEKIKLRQVEEEYWKFTDTSAVGNASHVPLITSASPATQQGELASLSTDKKTLIEGWLEDMKKSSKHPKIGLQPRSDTLRLYPVSTLTLPKIDEASSPPRVQGTTPNTLVSMQSDMPRSPFAEETLLQDSQRLEVEIFKDTVVEIVPTESNNRE